MNERLRRIESLIREGNMIEARETVVKLLTRKIPRAALVEVSRFARRVGLAESGVRLLHPLVRSEGRAGNLATDAERAEYAHCLIKIGAVDEGMALVDAPEVLASGHMAKWEYAAAIPLLDRFTKTKDLDAYARLIAQTNLAAAMIHERRHVQASYLLRGLLHETGLRKLRLLQGNALELSALLQWDRGKPAAAREFLDRAEKLLTRARGLSDFFVRKWKAILGGGPLDELRAEALAMRHWETVRECDRYEGKLLKAYFGTPYESYRRKLDVKVPKRFDWDFLGGDRNRRLDLVAPGKAIRAGGVPHRLLQAIAHDMYRPARIATLFARLFPEETYNPATAPPRVHQAIKLLRAALRKSALPLRIDESDGFYSLGATAPCTIVLHAGIPAPVDRRGSALRRLADEFGENEFSFAEAQSRLTFSTRTLHRLLNHAIRGGELTRTGRTTSTRYTITKKTSTAR